ncbi:hypothetical protein HZH66_010016 [Vespula vulgaris]|uniref:Uncharacterized protein n=1 Tax=Vespula vulgaris TaxID=7454 RepID=A0A834MYY0_VESVU|nr:hypothetical protein HZH66_010016 [Vespula vulgaris]
MTWDRVEEGGGGKDTIPAVPITSIEEFASAARGGANSISFTSHAKEDTGRSWIDTLAHLQNKSIPVHLPLRKMVPNQDRVSRGFCGIRKIRRKSSHFPGIRGSRVESSFETPDVERLESIGHCGVGHREGNNREDEKRDHRL